MTEDNPEAKKTFPKKSSLANLIKQFFTNSEENRFNQNAFDSLDLSRQNMIKGIFTLADKNARDIMIPRVDIIAIDSAIDFESLVKKVCEVGHSRLPVYKETIDSIIGILYSKDLLKMLTAKNKKFQLEKILHEPFFVPETMPLDELLLEFKNRKLHLALVIDEYGGNAGIITLEDILEEIVGEIQDEFDDDPLPEFKKIKANTYEIDSRLTISDFNEKTNLDLPTQEFDSISGFVFDLFGKIPKKNEEVKYKNISFKIKNINGTIIDRIRVTVSSKK